MLRRQGELLAQLRELPSSPMKVESSGGGGPPASCDGKRRRRPGSKRGRGDDKINGGEQHDEPAAARLRHSCKRRKKKQHKSRSLVTSVPDFDGYQWRKYGQKHIEGAMYARSYYRCTRSAEQSCPAKRTVQRNDDGGDDSGAAPEYTVVYMGEHTCTATDSLEAPVILETTAVGVPNTTSTNSLRPQDNDDYTMATGGIESTAAISDDMTWSSSGNSSDYYVVDDDYYCGLLVDVHGDSCAPAPAAAGSSSLQDLITGPIRSPVHIPEAAGWTFDDHLHFLLQQPTRNDNEAAGVSKFSFDLL